jgi:hypothetical protein
MCADCEPETYMDPPQPLRWCTGCLRDLPPDAFPRNRTGPCRLCHAAATRQVYRQRKLVAAAEALLAEEEALAQLWSFFCGMCGWETEVRRRATEKPMQVLAGAARCERCHSVAWASLVSGPATLAAAQPEIERLARARRR